MTSNKPYIVRAFYQWITDNQLTPYIVVDVSVYGVLVPLSYVNDGQIVLNLSISAVGTISLGENTIEFSARFGGKLEHIVVPYGAIGAIYAKENGAGTSFAIEHTKEQSNITNKNSPLSSVTSTHGEEGAAAVEGKPKGKPSLKIIK